MIGGFWLVKGRGGYYPSFLSEFTGHALGLWFWVSFCEEYFGVRLASRRGRSQPRGRCLGYVRMKSRFSLVFLNSVWVVVFRHIGCLFFWHFSAASFKAMWGAGERGEAGGFLFSLSWYVLLRWVRICVLVIRALYVCNYVCEYLVAVFSAGSVFTDVIWFIVTADCNASCACEARVSCRLLSVAVSFVLILFFILRLY